MKWRYLIPAILCAVAVHRPDAAYSDDVYQRARNACARAVGSSWEVARIDEARGIVHCKGPNRGRVVKVPFSVSKPKPPPEPQPQPEAAAPPVITPPKPPREKTSPPVRPPQPPVEAEIDPPEPEDDPPAATPAKTQESSEVLRGQAKAYCMEHFGKGSTVDHIDYTNWQVVCTKP